MTNYKGGDEVRGGFFWNMTAWDATYVEGQKGVLQGEASDNFVRIPVAAALLAAPLMGALFVIFLPFVGIALMAQHMLRATGLLASRAADRKVAIEDAKLGGYDHPAGLDDEVRDEIDRRR